MVDYSGSPNLFFRLVIAAGVVFVVTIFAMLVLPFGNPHSPVSQFLNEYGGVLIALEVAATLLIGLLAIVIDRSHSLRESRSDPLDPQAHLDSDATPDETPDTQT